MNRKVTGVLGYISLIGWLIAYFAGDREGAKFHLNQALVLNVVSIVLSVVSVVIGWIPVIGWLLALLIGIANIVLLVFWIMGIVAAVQDQDRPLPIIGGIELLH